VSAAASFSGVEESVTGVDESVAGVDVSAPGVEESFSTIWPPSGEPLVAGLLELEQATAVRAATVTRAVAAARMRRVILVTSKGLGAEN
jgi:hypothetical protein